MNKIYYIFIFLIILLIALFVILHNRNKNDKYIIPKNVKYLKKKGVNYGLGDRIGNYITYSLLAEIYNINIYTTWEKSERGNEYPDNIFEFIKFPDRLIFVSEEEYDNLSNVPELQFRWVYHGYDYIPETLHRSLTEDKQINMSYEDMMKVYNKICNQIEYKKDLPRGWENRPNIIHIRRGDKKGNIDNHKERIQTIINKYKNEEWIITSDDDIYNHIYNLDIPNLIKPKWNKDNKIRTLEEFFYYKHCRKIIQSVIEKGKYGGWTGFSYVPFKLGQAKYNNDKPILFSCCKDEEKTRFTHAKSYANKPLENILLFNDI